MPVVHPVVCCQTMVYVLDFHFSFQVGNLHGLSWAIRCVVLWMKSFLAQYNLEGKNKRKFAEIFCRMIYDVVLSKEKENEKMDSEGEGALARKSYQ